MSSCGSTDGGRLCLPTPEDYKTLGERVFGLVSAPQAQLLVGHSVSRVAEFARGDMHLAADVIDAGVSLTVDFNGRRGTASTNQLDEGGLKALVAEAEAAARQCRGPTFAWDILGPQHYPTPPTRFFGSVLDAMAGSAQVKVCQAALEAAHSVGLIAAGNLSFSLGSSAILNTQGLFGYDRGTYGGFSLTARTKDGTGSGWASSGFEDWSRVDTAGVIARAVDLAQRSANPVAVEPGRYTVILEPAALVDLIRAIPWSAFLADAGYTVFSSDPLGTNKIGLQVMDRRFGLISDPWDPDMPRPVFDYAGNPWTKVVWLERGVLRNLEYDRAYARKKGRPPVFDPRAYRLYAEGPTQTLDEMIASTRRGIWVNRLSNTGTMNARTLLLTGTTRDGTFLIENGKITKAIKNFRFTESPFFVLRKVETVGEPVRAASNIVAPRIKVRDFDFTSLTDAV